MKSFITGISGFVGPYLARHLIENGYEVSGIDRKGKALEGCSTASCDLLDKERVFEIVANEKPDFVFHLAAQSSVPKSWEIPELTKKINVEGTKNVLDAVVAAKVSPKILVVSSAQVYGTPKKEAPLTEETPLHPESPYAESRVEQEKLALDYAEKHKLKVFVSRSFNHTGPGKPEFFVGSDFANKIAYI
jgi:GDP-4-dehydro-6-deoxy-D-mannose reductase